MIRVLVAIAVLGCGGGTPGSAPPRPLPQESVRVTEPSKPGEPSDPGDPRVDELRRALVEMDPANPRSIESARKAAEAIGEARFVAAVPELVGLATRPPSKKIVAAQVAALVALGKLDGDRPRVVPALIKLIERDPPKREAKEAFALHLMITAKALDALAELRDPSAIPSLVPVVFRTPELAQQVRRAVTAHGPGIAVEFRKVLRGQHAAVGDKIDRYCGEAGDRPAAQCQRIAAREFYAAMMLGDLRDFGASADLLAALDRPAFPSYYIDDQPSPSTQHNAVFDALRKVGSRDAAAKLRGLWMTPRGDLATRIGAISAYAFVAMDTTGIDDLAKIAADNAADDVLRQEAASAYARLARDPKQIKPLLVLADKYVAASAKKKTEADRHQGTKAAADAKLDKAAKARDAAKQKLQTATDDPNATADQIRAATDAATRADDAFKQAKKEHRDKTAPYRISDDAARAYRGYARMFQTHVARIEVAGRCGDDIRCYTAALALEPAAAAQQLAKHVPGTATWTADEQRAIAEAYADRALIELAKRGPKAQEALPAVLANVATDNRFIREAILLALPRLAPRPCPSCVTALDRAIEGKTSDVTGETQIVRNYFTWAK